MKTPASDTELWLRASEGDREAFSALFRRMYPLLFQYGTKLCPQQEVVEDAIQELFLELWQRPDKPEVLSVRSYLLAALKFKLYKTFRRPPTVSTDGEDNGVFELSHESFLVEKEGEDERSRTMLSALNQLPPRQKEILYLRLYKGLGYDEISAVMNVNYQVLRNLFSQAVKNVRRLCNTVA